MTQPNVTPQEFKYLKEHVTARMIQILAEERGYSLEDAIDLVYTSPSTRNCLMPLLVCSSSRRVTFCLTF